MNLPNITKIARQRDRMNNIRPDKKGTQKFAFWDVETNNVKKGNNTKLVFDMAVVKVVKLFDDGKFKTKETYKVNSEYELACAVKNILEKHHRINFVAHNTAFDLRYSHLVDYLNSIDFTVNMYYETMSAFLLSMKFKYYRILFIDSMNWFNTSLANLANSIGMRKNSEDMFTKDRKKRFKYCENDVDIMIKAFARYKKWLWNEFNLNMRLTRGSDAFSCFRRELMPYDVKRHSNKLLLQKELASYYGGRTEAFKIGKLDNNTWYKFDINSMYPHIMEEGKFPIELARSDYEPKIDDAVNELQYYSGLAYVDCYIEQPAIPYRTAKNAIYPIGKINGYYCGNELKWILQYGKLIKLKEIHYYSKAPIFSKVISKLKKAKEKAMRENNELDRTTAKLLMNSIYGKFAQRNEEIIDSRPATNNRNENVYDIDDDYGLVKVGKIYGGREYTINPYVLSKYSFPIISSVVSADARQYLWNFIEEIGIKNIAYSDTDSLITNKYGADIMSQYLDDVEFGKWKFEGKSDNLIIHGLKDYQFGSDVKIKGIPKRAKKVSDNQYQYEQIGSLKSTGLGNVDPKSDIRTVTKTLARNYDKSILCKDCGYNAWDLSSLNHKAWDVNYLY